MKRLEAFECAQQYNPDLSLINTNLGNWLIVANLTTYSSRNYSAIQTLPVGSSIANVSTDLLSLNDHESEGPHSYWLDWEATDDTVAHPSVRVLPFTTSSGIYYNKTVWIDVSQELVVVPIEYCLVEIRPERCSIRLSPGLLLLVILFNGIKLLCLASTLLLRDFLPLATVGDALAAFLEHPESAPPRAIIQDVPDPQPTKGPRLQYRWFMSASKLRWSSASFL